MPGHPIIVRKSSVLFSALSIIIRLSALFPNCGPAHLYGSESAPSLLLKRINRMDGSGGRENPGGLVITGLPTKEPSPIVQSLPPCLGELIAVIQDSHVDSSLPQLPPLLLASSVSLGGLPLRLAHHAASIGPYSTAPITLVQTPDRWVNAILTAL